MNIETKTFFLTNNAVSIKIPQNDSQKSYRCGRAKENNIICLSRLVSRNHCVFFHSEGDLYVIDSNSSNGIYINDILQQPNTVIKLNNNDVIGIGCCNTTKEKEEKCIFKFTILSTKTRQKNKNAPNNEESNIPLKVPKLSENENLSDAVKKSTKDENIEKKHNLNQMSSSALPITDNKITSPIINKCQSKSDSDQDILICYEQKASSTMTSSDGKYNNDKVDNMRNSGSAKEALKNQKIIMEQQKVEEGNIVQQHDVTKHSERNIGTHVSSNVVLEQFETKKVNDIHTNDPIEGTLAKQGTVKKEQAVVSDDIVTQYSSIKHSKENRETPFSPDINFAQNVPKTQNEDSEQIYNMSHNISKKGTDVKKDCISLENVYKKSHEIIPNYTEVVKTEVIETEQLGNEIKKETSLEFSIVDYIELSDDESNCFPSSQLFNDEPLNDSSAIKTEIQFKNNECDNFDQTVRIENNTDNIENNKQYNMEEIIDINSDSEDDQITYEWMKKLSKSQSFDPIHNVAIKTEVLDEEIREQDQILDVGEDVDLRKVNKSIDEEFDQPMDVNITVKNTEMFEKDKVVHENVSSHSKENKKIKASSAEKSKLKSAARLENGEESSSNSSKKIVDVQKRQKYDERSNELKNSSNKSSNKKMLPIIEPPHLTNGVHKGVSCSIKSNASKLSSSSEGIIKNSDTKRLSKKEKQEAKQLVKIKQREYAEEEKRRRLNNKWINLPLKKKPPTVHHTKEEKKRIANERKIQLKALAAEQKANTEKNMSEKRTSNTSNKPKVKVSEKSRGDLLTESFVQTSITVPQTVKRKPGQQCVEGLKAGHSLPTTYTIPLKKADMENCSEKQKSIVPNETTVLQSPNVPTYQDLSRRNVLSQISPENVKTYRRRSILKSSNNNIDIRQVETTNKTSKLKKNVSFSDDLISVKTFFIPDENKLQKFIKEPPVHIKTFPTFSLDEFLMCIFKWNPIWLEEQQRIANEPPVVNQGELIPLLTQYKSFEDYYAIMKPLLLLELWHILVKEFENCNKYGQLYGSFVHKSVNSLTTNSDMQYTILHMEMLVNKEKYVRQQYPTVGELVYFEYFSNGKIYRVFGYITNIYRTVISHTTQYNKNLQEKIPNAHGLIMYTIQTKFLSSNPESNRVLRFRSVTYLRSHLRMIQALQHLPSSPLMNQILYPKIEQYQLPSVACNKKYSLVSKGTLNDKQLEAVLKTKRMLVENRAKICLIQGPPGTGKSRVIVNIVTEIYADSSKRKQPLRILLCAPSNAAVDELALRLLEIRKNLKKEERFRMVRVGRTEAMHPKVKCISISEFIEREMRKNYGTNNESVEEEKRYLEAQINALNVKLATSSCANDKSQIQIKLAKLKEKYTMLSQRNLLANDLQFKRENQRSMQYQIEKTILQNADIIVCTLNSCYMKSMESVFKKIGIELCIVDEATQSCEAETLIPLMLGVRFLVLVGDSKQLPATVISQNAKRLGLDQSLFCRIQNIFEEEKENPVITLTTQYRMADPILHWPNKYFYSNQLCSEMKEDMNFPLHAYHVFNLDSNQDSVKFSNDKEAEFVAKIIICIMSFTKLVNGDKLLEIGVITPYNDQKLLISKKIRDRISALPTDVRGRFITEVNTVDGFQGQERDIIIMSCVRSDGIGFLSDRQRLCVALTRAKHSLFLCGNFKTFLKDPMWNALLSDARSRGIFIDITANAQLKSIKKNIFK